MITRNPDQADSDIAAEGSELPSQLEQDSASLRAIIPGLDALESQWNDARITTGARTRGYFTPDEDDRVRQILLAYRNYRLGLYEIIRRCWCYAGVPDPALRIRMFLIGFATGLTLYARSLKLIEAYEREPLVRKKLNEPDAKFEMPEGFFDHVLRSYSSLGNYSGIIGASWFWLKHRREITRHVKVAGSDAAWLVQVILRERGVVRKRLAHVLACRLRHDWRAFLSTTVGPLRRAQYGLQSLIGGAGANLRTCSHYRPCLKPSLISQLRGVLRPGDILLMRAEKKLTSAILPGFWAHAALYVGTRNELEILGISNHPHVARHWDALGTRDRAAGCVIEAISPAVRIVSLPRCLFADHVLALRPILQPEQKTAALVEAFGHVGKPYDFEFDFNVSTRIVCTELIYRCYHRPGGFEFPLVKRLGRFTLTGDDLAGLAIHALDQPPDSGSRMEIVGLALGSVSGQADFVEPGKALEALERIQSGWRPNLPAEANQG